MKGGSVESPFFFTQQLVEKEEVYTTEKKPQNLIIKQLDLPPHTLVIK